MNGIATLTSIPSSKRAGKTGDTQHMYRGPKWEMRSLGMNESGSGCGSRLMSSVGVLGIGCDWDRRLPLAVTW